MCDELRRGMKRKLKEFRNTLERYSRKALRDIKAGVVFISQSYGEIRDDLNAVLTENKELKSANEKLGTT